MTGLVTSILKIVELVVMIYFRIIIGIIKLAIGALIELWRQWRGTRQATAPPWRRDWRSAGPSRHPGPLPYRKRRHRRRR
jgi:hypothetical protein